MEDGPLRYVSKGLFYPPWAGEDFECIILFFFLVLLEQKNLLAIFFYKFFCSSRAGEFSRHLICGKLLYEADFFFKGKRF